MALSNLFVGELNKGTAKKKSSNEEPTPGPNWRNYSEKPTLEQESIVKGLIMDMVGSRTDWNDKEFMKSYGMLRQFVGNEKADKLYTSIVAFNTNPNSINMSPEQRYSSWSGLYHNDDYVRDFARRLQFGHPMFEMNDSPSSWAKELLNKETNTPKEDNKSLKEDINRKTYNGLARARE